MDANSPAVGDAGPAVPGVHLETGQELEIRESGQCQRAIDDGLTDASVLWVRIDGHAPRPIYLAGDPVEILLELENPVAF